MKKIKEAIWKRIRTVEGWRRWLRKKTGKKVAFEVVKVESEPRRPHHRG